MSKWVLNVISKYEYETKSTKYNSALKRCGEPEEVAAMTAFLASTET